MATAQADESSSGVKILSVNEAAAALGIGRRTLERESARGTGPLILLLSERRRGIRASDLDAWLTRRANVRPDW